MSEYRVPIGSTLVNLTDFVEEGSQGETNLGNALTDSMVVAFDETTIAFINDGGIRCSMVKRLESVKYQSMVDSSGHRFMLGTSPARMFSTSSPLTIWSTW